MGNHDKFTYEQMEKALRKALGIQAIAAQMLDCEWNTVHRYVKKYKKLQDIVNQSKEVRLDIAESKLMQGINAGIPALIIFLLKTQGKDRGYVERQEHTGKDGEPIMIQNVRNAIEEQLKNNPDLVKKVDELFTDGD